MEANRFFSYFSTNIKTIKPLENSDLQILKGLKNNSESAFDELFRKYYKNLVYFSMKTVKNKESAEEIVQDLLVNFWEKRHQLEPTISLKAYLYRAVYNNSVHYVKNDNKYPKTDVTEAYNLGSDFDNLLEQTELESRIFNLIEELPTECKKIFKLSRFEEMKYKEIAEQLDISVKTVETQMSRALKFIKTNLADYFKVLIFMILEIRN